MKDEKFGIIYYFSSPGMVFANNIVKISNFVPGLNILTIPLSLYREFAHVGLIIFCEKNKIFVTHKIASYIAFYQVFDEASAIKEMNLSNHDNKDQRLFSYYYEVKENVKINDIYKIP